MGCNSSKESAPQNEADDNNKENEEKSTDDGKAPAEENTVENHLIDSARSDTKSSSAKTITLRSNGTAKSIEDPQDPSNRVSATEETDVALKTADEEEAATKIQAAFRGHKTRKSMKQPAANEEREPTREELENEFRLDDAELCNAATKIQASFRGHMSRKQIDKKGDVSCSSKEDKLNQDDAENVDNIDLTDPELNKAAAKIQASFRGHMTRKELPDEVKTASK
ncbi:uncharacterized protein LOC132697679 [Cylas formicarius]|uniref:uncharacterized protein LOC132697679 n=1 Tax=Cylas formicarius TaxID=197179 RepID=UPI0029588F5F|nr:uncharacterized protein LOC132697679 [Cylas formicarius]